MNINYKINKLLVRGLDYYNRTVFEIKSNNLGTQNDNNDNENWKQKYEELDATWRQKYRDRFMNSQTTEEDVIEEQEDNVETDGELKEYDELFEEREG